SRGIEDDVESAGLLHDAVDALVYACVIENVDHRRTCFAAARCDLLGHGFQAGLRPAGQKDAHAFRCELLCNRSADGASGAENDGILVLQNASIHELYRVPEIVTLGRLPGEGESDSRWRTKEVRHVGSDTLTPGF